MPATSCRRPSRPIRSSSEPSSLSTNTVPSPRTATRDGSPIQALRAGPSKPARPVPPVPAIVVITPCASTRRRRPLAPSASRNPPSGSPATPHPEIRARVAGPPSPENPERPVPATATTRPSRRMRHTRAPPVARTEPSASAPTHSASTRDSPAGRPLPTRASPVSEYRRGIPAADGEASATHAAISATTADALTRMPTRLRALQEAPSVERRRRGAALTGASAARLGSSPHDYARATPPAP